MHETDRKKQIFVSTACLEGECSLAEILEIYGDRCIQNIELGSSHHYVNDVEKLLSNYPDANFIIHNYFPPPERPFIMNLASQDERIRENSIDICKKAVDLCKMCGCDLYSFHPGFRVETTLNPGFDLSSAELVPYEKALSSFYSSLEEIYDYARRNGVNLALENLEHKNQAYMMTQPEDFKELLDIYPDFGILLDLGHLKIASRRLGFKMNDFVEVVKENVFGVHVHENDGNDDLHLEPMKSETVENYVALLNCSKIIIESRNMDIDSIEQNVEFLSRYIG